MCVCVYLYDIGKAQKEESGQKTKTASPRLTIRGGSRAYCIFYFFTSAHRFQYIKGSPKIF